MVHNGQQHLSGCWASARPGLANTSAPCANRNMHSSCMMQANWLGDE
jgi:hypothetical protein